MQIVKLSKKHLDDIFKFFSPLDEDLEDSIKEILLDNMSFGYYENNQIKGIILGYEISFDGMQILDDEKNSIYIEIHANDEEIRNRLISTVESEAIQNDYDYIIVEFSTPLSKIIQNPQGLAKTLLKNGFYFIKPPNSDTTIAFKKLED
jgi:hypothetical protein